MKKYVVDTSVIIEKAISKLVKEGKIKGIILVPNAVVAELENQANKGHEIGFIGLEELQTIRKLKDIKIEFIGSRPTETQIKFAKSGEIDALIRELANQNNAILVTADKVQSESGKVFGLEVMYIKLKEPKEKLAIEKFFDKHTMSVHLKQDCYPAGKKGHPGEWKLVKISDKKLSSENVQEIAKEIVEKSRIDPDTFIEISRRGSTVVQYKDYRVVIVRPPVSDGWEITAVKPLTKLKLEDYKLDENVESRIKNKARGIIIAGEVGSGKSTFCQAIAEFYDKNGRVTKTIESPRDLQLNDSITQYSKNFTSSEELHDILFLSRPDNIIFDEMRDTPDFKLYTDLRLSGSNVLGVLHSSSAIDAVQRFITRLETGMIPSVLDTIIFIEKGAIGIIYTLKMLVKVPTGMTESDLARPVVEIRDFQDNKLKYEIYSYGEETVVIPIEEEKPSGAKGIAMQMIEKELRKYVSDINVELANDNKAIIYVPEPEISRVIGKKGTTIDYIEKKLGISIDVRPLTEDKNQTDYKIGEDKRHLIFYVNKMGRLIDFFVNEDLLFSATAGKKGEIKVNKKSPVGKILLEALDNNKEIILKT